MIQQSVLFGIKAFRVKAFGTRLGVAALAVLGFGLGNLSGQKIDINTQTKNQLDPARVSFQQPGGVATTVQAVLLQLVPVSGLVSLNASGVYVAKWPSNRTYSVAPICTATDNTAANPVRITTTPTNILIQGTRTDLVSYICIGGSF